MPKVIEAKICGINTAEAVQISGALAIDVSSGVEDKPGVKNPEKVAAFLAKAKGL